MYIYILKKKKRKEKKNWINFQEKEIVAVLKKNRVPIKLEIDLFAIYVYILKKKKRKGRKNWINFQEGRNRCCSSNKRDAGYS